jgi:hypothetical protein
LISHRIHLTLEVKDIENRETKEVEAIIKRRLETSLILDVKVESFDGGVTMIHSSGSDRSSIAGKRIVNVRYKPKQS